jgi:chromosome segregation ATPase
LKALIDEANRDRDAVQKDMEVVRGDLGKKRNANNELRAKAEQSANSVAQLREAINQLDADMKALKTVNAEDINRLEDQRQQNEATISDLRVKLSDSDHDHNSLKLLIEKTKNEIEYLGSEKEKHQSQNYQKRIDDFIKNIADSEKKTGHLGNELKRLSEEWLIRLQLVTKQTEETIKSNEHEDHVRKLNRLLQDLDDKNKELEALQARRDELLKQVSTEDSSSKDENNKRARQELDNVNNQLLDLLNEKNQMYDDLVKNTRELLDIDNELQANSHEIARLTQEYGILRKEVEQKEKIIHDLRIILEQRRQEIVELKQLIDELRATLKERDDEAARLRKLAAEKEAQIRDLERQLEEMRVKPPTPEPIIEAPPAEPVIEVLDDIDAMLAQFINISGCPVPIKRLGGGYYYFGTKKIYAKIMNGKLVIRVGGGYMSIEEFIKSYGEQELIKVNQRRQNGLDIFTGQPLKDMEKSPKSGKSPKGKKSPKNIAGTDCPTQLTADDIKKYKE